MEKTQTAVELHCALQGIGAWGPGFNNWLDLQALFSNSSEWNAPPVTKSPKPDIIPANERRRAPLPVRAAVEVSWQALQQSGISAEQVACVFGSGLGDTEITDYMCRVLTTEEKQLSPTKFHNSVHNAAAGYWTISTGCMKSANSIAGYQMTAGLALLEGIIHCVLENEPVLITLFDIAAHQTYRQIFNCEHSFAAALLVTPLGFSSATPLAVLSLETAEFGGEISWDNPILNRLYQENPAAKVLALLEAVAHCLADTSRAHSARLGISPSRTIAINMTGCAR